MSQSVYKIITDRILEHLESGTVPWRQPWQSYSIPMNLVSKKQYRGINPFLLAMRGYTSPYWLSYKQCAALGGQVRKGEKSTPVVFWTTKETTEKDSATGKDKKKKLFILRYYNVFNVEQCDGIKEPERNQLEFKPIARCEEIVAGYADKPIITVADYAYYSPAKDIIGMPRKESFTGEEEYYSTLFHEMVHSTGAEKRLNRAADKLVMFGSEDYSKEELVAEFGAAFLCAEAHIENRTIENSAAYIQAWKKVLKNDSRLVVQASAQAQKATDYILGRKYENGEE